MFKRLKVILRRWRLPHAPHRPAKLMQKLGIVSTLLLILVLAVVFWFQKNLRPMVEQMALSRVNYLAGQAINQAVNEQVAADGSGYEYFIDLEKDGSGKITALKTDMVAINRFKAEVTARVLEHIRNLERSKIGIPLGNVIGGELFSGRGPDVPVIVVPVGSAHADFSSVLKTAGINQTRHQIVVTVSAEVSVVLPGFTVGTTVSSQVVVAETIIVGEVPNSYTYLEDSNRSSFELYSALDSDRK